MMNRELGIRTRRRLAILKSILRTIIKWYGYITKSTISAINSFIWIHVGVFALTSLVGETSLITYTWSWYIIGGLLCYEFYQRKWIVSN